MTTRQFKILTPLILLAYLLAQNGIVLAQTLAGLTGHEVVSTWHVSHYDVMFSHGAETAPVMADDGCQVSCDDHHHVDIKPIDPVRPDTKSKFFVALLLMLLPTLLVWLVPLVRSQPIRWSYTHHRNTLPRLIRSTVLRH